MKKIKKGDKQLKEQFIKDYIPFILNIVSGFCSYKTSDLKSSDEYSIGLIAFDEAIERFDIGRSKNFLKFAEMVIRRRMIDYYRKTSSIDKKEIPFSYFYRESEKELEGKLNMYDIGQESDRYELIWELKDFSKKLESFWIEYYKTAGLCTKA